MRPDVKNDKSEPDLSECVHILYVCACECVCWPQKRAWLTASLQPNLGTFDKTLRL